VKSCPQPVTTIPAANEVLARFGPRKSSEKLVKRTIEQNTLDAVVHGVAVIASSPTNAIKIANAVEDVSNDLVKQLQTKSRRVHATEVLIDQPATASVKPSSPDLPTIFALGLSGGLETGQRSCISRDGLDRLAEASGRMLFVCSLLSHPLEIPLERAASMITESGAEQLLIYRGRLDASWTMPLL
jgi:uncharacterized protein involved in exopolysaccharide biosynthesis